jgi:ABC-type sulfate transport system permease component
VQFVINTCILLLIAALPIAAAGLGTGQLAFVALFERWSDPETLLAASLTLSLAMIVTRAGMGLLFAREFTREALTASREADR